MSQNQSRRESLPQPQKAQSPEPNEPSKEIVEASRMPIVWHRPPSADDDEDDDIQAKYSIDFAPSFNKKEIRLKFIRKVYLLLTVQLVYTASFIALALGESHVRMYFYSKHELGIAGIVIALVVCLILLSLESVRKNYPLNLILLCAYTIFASFGLATIAAQHSPYLILSGASVTVVVCAFITLLACQNWIDITRWWGILVVLIVVVILVVAGVTFVDLKFGYLKVLHIVYAGIFTFVISVYFLYITQLIIGGKWYELSPEEYIFAVILFYTGIARLLLATLGIITNVSTSGTQDASRMRALWLGVPGEEEQQESESFHFGSFTSNFNRKEIRSKFIRKVYLLLTVLLLYTAGIIALCVFEPHVRIFFVIYWWVGLICLIAFLILYTILTCFESTRKSFPLNFVMLGALTFFSAFGFGAVASNYTPEIVLHAAATTAGICGFITLLACQSWIDITGCGGLMYLLSMVVMIFGTIVLILHFVVGYNRVLYLVYAGIAAFIVCVYFLYVTQLIMGGKRYELSPEEYILAVIILYTEIMHLFILMLIILGGGRR